MPNGSLVQPLIEGDVDLVGDIHGEIEALHTLMRHLNYNGEGIHPDGRRLVFLGDLTDRGPDSIAVVELVQRLVERGAAQCVLGNHDLNILLNDRKPENGWFFSQDSEDEQGQTLGQKSATAEHQERIRRFFATLPLALERSDLRVVHACWDTCCVPSWNAHWGVYWDRPMIEIAREHCDVKSLYDRYAAEITHDISGRHLDKPDTKLHYQNRNPVKLITSGPEQRTDEPFMAGGKWRYERRVEWWNDYTASAYCVFGHYAAPPGEPHGASRAICIDPNVANKAAFKGGFCTQHYAAEANGLDVSSFWIRLSPRDTSART